VHVDGVARTGRDVLDRQATLHSKAPLVRRVTAGLSGAIVGSMHIVRGNRQLGETPGLVNTESADDVGCARPTPIVVAVDAVNHVGRSRARQVPEVRL